MSQPDSVLSAEECFAILQRWKKDGLTEEERNDFITKASGLLRDDSDMVDEFLRRVSEAAKLTQEIWNTFDEVKKWLQEVGDWNWFLIVYEEEWDGLKDRFRSTMFYSTDVAMVIVGILDRFDRVYLAQVESIQTEQDRHDAMSALKGFVTELEQKDQSAETSRRFLELKRDIEDFERRLRAEVGQNLVLPLTSNIEALDAQITAAQNLIGVLGGSAILRALGLGAKGSDLIASLQYHRDKQADTLNRAQKAVATVKSLVVPPEERSIFDDPPPIPDISKIYDNLIVFAEIWSSVRSQCVQFNEIISRSLEAATNMGFKKQVSLAREVCVPLREGVREYARLVRTYLDWP